MAKRQAAPAIISDNGTETKVTLVFNPPNPDEPGFFRRAMEVQEAFEKLQAGGGTAELKALIGYLAQYFDGPEEDIRERLLDASRNDIRRMVEAIVGSDGTDPFG